MSPTSVNENAGETDFTVTATHNGGTTTRTVGHHDWTHPGLGGTAGSSDYTVNPSQASVTIPANQSSGSGTLTLTLTDDELIEGDETIIVGGSSSGLSVIRLRAHHYQ